MTTLPAPASSLHEAPHAAVVTAIVVALVWVVVAAAVTTKKNQMKEIPRGAALLITTLPAEPVRQLAFARSQADIDAVLDVKHTSKQRKIDSVGKGNAIDTIALVPGYTLLLISLALLMARSSGPAGPRVFGAGLLLTIALGLADLTENYGIAAALKSAQFSQPMSDGLRKVMVAAAFVKWMLLGLIGSGLGVVIALRRYTWPRLLLAMLLLTVSLVILAGTVRHGVTLLPAVPAATTE